MKNLDTSLEQSDVENTENNSQSSSENTEYEGVNETICFGLLVARCISGKWFATAGNYRISGDYRSKRELEDAMHTPNWECIAAILAAQGTYYENLNK